jgi:hypothetical protein
MEQNLIGIAIYAKKPIVDSGWPDVGIDAIEMEALAAPHIVTQK